MKIFFYGDSPTVDTGFGVVSKNVLTGLHKLGHEIVVLGINEYAQNPRLLKQFPFPIYPCDRGAIEQVYGYFKLWPIIEAENPDVLFMLNDPWIIGKALEQRPEKQNPMLKTVGYYPTDSAPLKPAWMKVLNGLDAQICYTKYAENVVTKSNGSRPENLHQVYHGVDTSKFFPVTREEARGKLGLGQDFFIVGMVARNQPRKRFDLLMMAFAEFSKDKPNAKLYLHTGLRDVGFDIIDIARQLKMEDKLILTEDLAPNKGVSEERLNLIYNTFDINTLISLGDGFGLPVAESMATGCTQLVSGHSALQELVEGHGGLTVKNAAYMMNASGINTWGMVSDVEDMVKKLNILYKNPELRNKYAKEGYEFITSDTFKWPNIVNQFNSIFKGVMHVL